jgi:hypothetical protein
MVYRLAYYLQNRHQRAMKNQSTELLGTDGGAVAFTSDKHKTVVANRPNTTVYVSVHISAAFPF